MKRIKKLIIGAAAVAVLGAYFGAKTSNYHHVVDVARIANEVVIRHRDYEGTLLEELSKTGDERMANSMIEQGSFARKRINTGNFPADDFVQNPYDLMVAVEHTPQGDQAYLRDIKANQNLPIYRDNQVGDVSHRILGLYHGAKRELKEGLEVLKAKAMLTIDGIMEKLEGQNDN